MNYIFNKLNPKYYIGDRRIKTNIDDYSFASYKNGDNGISLNYNFSKDILFNPDYTENGIFLKYKGLDSAVIGFNISNNSVDCLQIQGGRKRFKQLTPIEWDKGLVEELLNYSIFNNMKRVTILPWFKVEGDEFFLKEKKLRKRYDLNAIYHNFKFSNLEKLYIHDLK